MARFDAQMYEAIGRVVLPAAQIEWLTAMLIEAVEGRISDKLQISVRTDRFADRLDALKNAVGASELDQSAKKALLKSAESARILARRRGELVHSMAALGEADEVIIVSRGAEGSIVRREFSVDDVLVLARDLERAHDEAVSLLLASTRGS